MENITGISHPLDVNEVNRIKKAVKSCTQDIARTTGHEEIVGWTVSLLREGPVRFGRLVFEVIDTEGRYYAGEGETSRGDDTLWDTLSCKQTVALLTVCQDGTPFIDLGRFANKAVRSWLSDWGDSPPSSMKYPEEGAKQRDGVEV